ncbi:DUF4282 domain-containing protein [Actinomadura harenae]|uniref:DUF4282 domain-containing protein n=1 Tax=Actinomadura harenae TaxID=2483351 RepID=A0A3M2LN94_9ACTN|nr:DUF4282 domain-containing protein [Actinomadura harenae]RMI38832.1 DUF4282 domain-containing protein [Actinomadura harenae]
MTHPSDPGQSQPPGAAGHPYGPPPPPPSGPPQPPPSYQRPGPLPGPRPSTPDPGTGPQRAWVPPQRSKGLLGALLDANFDTLVTPKLIKFWYILAILLISLQCLAFLLLGVKIASWDDFWGWGVIMAVASPLVWLFELLMVRILMEAVMVRFKGVEYLHVIKDKI